MQTVRPLFFGLILLQAAASTHALDRDRTTEQAPAAAPLATKARATHTVVAGESMAAIAKRFHITERQLRFYNLLPEPHTAFSGQLLQIPEPTLRVPGDWQRQYAEGRLPGHEFAVHEVRRGETLSMIAAAYELDSEQLKVLNPLDDPNQLEVGDHLRLPVGAARKPPVIAPQPPRQSPRIVVTRDTPIGVYEVARGDTLTLIASRFGLSYDQLQSINTLPDPNLIEIGDRLLVPDPNRRLPPAKPPSIYTFMWPLDDYEIVSEFGGRGDREHRGTDMAARSQAPIRASADGEVLFAGEQRGYGKVVIVAHGNGVETLYAHNTRNLVRRGQEVRQGQTIATVGNTGNARGDHVHFEYIVDGDSKEPREHIERVLRTDYDSTR